MEELQRALRQGEGQLALAWVILLGLSPEEVDRAVKASRVEKTLEEETEEA